MLAALSISISRAPACAAESPKLSLPGAAQGRLANFSSGPCQTILNLTAGPGSRCVGPPFPMNKSPACYVHTGANSAWCSSNMPGLGPGDRRCKSCRADHFKNAVVAEHMRHPPSKRNDAGGIPAGSAIAR